MTNNTTASISPQGEWNEVNNNNEATANAQSQSTQKKTQGMNSGAAPNSSPNTNTNPNRTQNTNRQYQPQPPQPRPAPIYIRQTKSGFLTFVFACIPGAGQMYQGLFKKGVSLMAVFFLLLGISSWAFVPPLIFLMPVVWFYSFFDAINRMRMTVSELALIKDDYLFFSSSEQNSRLSMALRRRHKLVGWLLVGVGVYTLFDMFSGIMIDYIGNQWFRQLLWNIQRTLPALGVAIACVGIGVYVIRGSLKKQMVQSNEQEINTAQC